MDDSLFEKMVFIVAAIIFVGAAGMYAYFAFQPNQSAPSGILVVLGFGLAFIKDLLKDKESNRQTERVADRAANGAATLAVSQEMQRRGIDNADNRE